MGSARLLLVVLGMVFTVASAQAEQRLALVLGNSDYLVGPLTNPVNDAKLVRTSLEEAGFEVTMATDLTYRDMQRAVVMFGRQLAAAGDDTVGMVYYAGHAVQSGGENYLIPVDATLQDELDLEIQTLEMSTLMKSLERAGNRLNMVVLDACRNNPFKSISRSGTRGLAKVDAPQGTLVAYSTAPGDVALDGTGANSPYTEAFAKVLKEPGLPVEHVFKKVRIEVMARTNQQQVPWESSSLTGDFFFQDAAPTPAPQVSAPASQPDQTQTEIAFWTSIATSNDTAMFEGYLNAYPNGMFASIAQQRIGSLQAEQQASAERQARASQTAEAKSLWESVKDSNDPAVLQTLASRFPNTVYAELAAARIETLTARQSVASAAAPAAPTQADSRSDQLFWQSIQHSSNKADYQAYLARFPDGLFSALARDRAANGYQPQVAALAPVDAVPDGDYSFTAKSLVAGSWDMCRADEIAQEDVEVSDGRFSEYARSNHGAAGAIRGKRTDNGGYSIRMVVDKWRTYTWVADLKQEGDSWVGIANLTNNGNCRLHFTLTRK